MRLYLNKHYFFIFFMIALNFAEQGDIIDFEQMDYMSRDEVQQELDDVFGSFAPEAKYDVSLYKISYETIDPFGEYTIASGIIAYPISINEAFPILSFQHGTVVAQDNVSSEQGFNGLTLWMASTGYIFIEPDYLGFGINEGLHPYCMKFPSAWATIDMIRASETFCIEQNDIESNNDLLLAGYSEGGYVTMAASMLINQELSDEINVTAAFPMAGPYDLSGVMVDLMLEFEPYDQPFYLPFTLVSYIEYYQMGELSDYFLPEYAEMFDYLFDGEYSGSYINSLLPNIPMEVVLPEVIEDFSNNFDHPLRVKLEENNLWNWIPEMDMYLFHGVGDELVPYENSLVAYNSFIEQGAENVSLYSVPEEFGGHSDVAIYCLISAYQISEENYKHIRIVGDINGDTILNIQDIIMLINFIIYDMPWDHLDQWLADIDHNLSVDVLDVILLLDNILSN